MYKKHFLQTFKCKSLIWKEKNPWRIEQTRQYKSVEWNRNFLIFNMEMLAKLTRLLLTEGKYLCWNSGRSKSSSITYAKSTCWKLNMGTFATVYCLLLHHTLKYQVFFFFRWMKVYTLKQPDTKFSIRLSYKQIHPHDGKFFPLS